MPEVNLLFDSARRGFARLAYLKEASQRRQQTARRLQRLRAVVLGLWLAAFVALTVPVAPYALYKVFPGMTERVARALGTTADVAPSAFGEVMYEKPVVLPPVDPTLPLQNRLVIEKIGVDTEIGGGEDWEEALRVGAWREGKLGTPEDRLPMMVAAHRFGYLAWTNRYRRENSFFNLPKLENGDQVEIIWNQRRFVYEIYEGYTDTQIRGFDFDLMLYTCEVLNSDRRVVRLARWVNQGDSGEDAFGELLSHNVDLLNPIVVDNHYN